ncbi:hypothetical protein H072_9772 [Dactylellina haptotyla CBS 200.50]|uniref:Ecp2 effector protein domain-containing protein n=1 Tax=Dactylellina haptotyla (strain CBS 200.50) TaxID=1284197 RepID=S8A114_DACHA|nr:hypothetical protein H072_9772 [Dactylellina haptotyla CBS 200.50]
MRFATIVTTLATTALVASHPAANPAPISSDVPAWIESLKDAAPEAVVRVKDIDPNSPQGDLIIGRVYNLNETETEPSSTSTFTKRYSKDCEKGPFWVLQDPVQRMKDSVCNFMSGNGPPQYGGSKAFQWDHYSSASGSWEQVRDIDGGLKKGWWYLKAPRGAAWDWNACFNTYFELVWACKGKNPDTAGGKIWGYGSGWDASITFTN